MRAEKTVFIVGAGASDEVGILFGRKFIDKISEKLNYQFRGPSLDPDWGDSDILDVIQQYAQDRPTLNRYLDGARRIREGIVFSRSIDAFIDVHRDDKIIQRLGKLAIVKTILEQERQAYMYIASPGAPFQDVGKLNDSWFVNLVRGLNEGVRRESIDLIFQRISFVVFNYDRCVEHLLYNALQQHYGIDGDKARAVMQTLTILHPYGKIANLPWQGADGISFGFSANRGNLMMMEGQIKTYTEQIENNDTLLAIKNEIAGAETLVFLGFSYLDLNMAVLDPDEKCAAKNVFGSAISISESNVDEIKEQIRRLVRVGLTENRMRGGIETITERLHIRSDLRCAGLLEEYSQNLFVVGRGSRN